jgi:nitrate reductase NapD
MNLSGIAVSVRPQSFDDTVDRLAALPGIEIHYQDSDSARIVVVQEAESIDAEVAGLKQIKSVPGVVVAELVYHYFAEDDGIENQTPADLDETTGISQSVLQRLNPTADFMED